MTLLEVLIAFTLILMCLFPLIYPHVYMQQAESEFVHKIELDHAVNLLYGDIIVSLQMNDIPWDDIVEGRTIDIDEEFLKKAGYEKYLPFKGTYRFTVEKNKSSDSDPRSIYLLNLIFSFEPKRQKKPEAKVKPLVYRYKVFLVQDLGGTLEVIDDQEEGNET